LPFWTLSIVQFFIKNIVSETKFCLRLQVKAYSVGPNRRSSSLSLDRLNCPLRTVRVTPMSYIYQRTSILLLVLQEVRKCWGVLYITYNTHGSDEKVISFSGRTLYFLNIYSRCSFRTLSFFIDLIIRLLTIFEVWTIYICSYTASTVCCS
jgi:hypothetical protein